jgi:flagellar biosynthesis/type III secretory pathway M-ring protein FliF/YscJ
MPLGSIKRLSVSVLVDHNLRWEGAGPKAKRILEPPTQETLDKIKELVAATAGVSLPRGDTISVLALPFEATLQQEPPPAPPAPVVATPGAQGAPGTQGAPNPNALFGIQLPVLPLPAWVPGPLRDTKILLLVAVALLLVLIGAAVFLFLRFKKKKAAKAKAKAAAAAALSSEGAPGTTGGVPALEADSEADSTMINPNHPTKSIAEQVAEQRARLEAGRPPLAPLPGPTTNKAEVLTRHLTEEAKKDPAGVAYILRNWLEQDDLAR